MPTYLGTKVFYSKKARLITLQDMTCTRPYITKHHSLLPEITGRKRSSSWSAGRRNYQKVDTLCFQTRGRPWRYGLFESQMDDLKFKLGKK